MQNFSGIAVSEGLIQCNCSGPRIVIQLDRALQNSSQLAQQKRIQCWEAKEELRRSSYERIYRSKKNKGGKTNHESRVSAPADDPPLSFLSTSTDL
jgi:hypothetical protein